MRRALAWLALSWAMLAKPSAEPVRISGPRRAARAAGAAARPPVAAPSGAGGAEDRRSRRRPRSAANRAIRAYPIDQWIRDAVKASRWRSSACGSATPACRALPDGRAPSERRRRSADARAHLRSAQSRSAEPPDLESAANCAGRRRAHRRTVGDLRRPRRGHPHCRFGVVPPHRAVRTTATDARGSRCAP
jgi:hypothetical protein